MLQIINMSLIMNTICC